jgi:expansin (peptidoglycan-binding protein)
MNKAALVLFISLLFVGNAFSVVCKYSTVTTGTITFHPDYDNAAASNSGLTVHCGLDWPLEEGDSRVTAIVDYQGAKVCGNCLKVGGPLGYTYVRIIDQCDGCDRNNNGHGLDLSRESFSKIGSISDGILFETSWSFVPCPASLIGFNGNLVYRFKDGSSQWWIQLQILNSVQPIRSIKYMGANMNTWATTTLQTHNYVQFNNIPGSGVTTPLRVRITSENLEVIVLTINTILDSEAVYKTTTRQFKNGCKECVKQNNQADCNAGQGCLWKNNDCLYQNI